MQEIPLAGGSMTAVVRVGDTVRRAAGPWTPTIHALLRHVRAAGFTAAPEPLGLDEQGREILSFLPGGSGPIRWSPSCGPTRCSSASRRCCARSRRHGGLLRRALAVAGASAVRGDLPQRLLPVQPPLRGHRADRGDRLRSRLARAARLGPGADGVSLRPAHRPREPGHAGWNATSRPAGWRSSARPRRPRGDRHVRGRARPPARADRLHRRRAPPRATRPSRPCSPAATS